MADTRLTKIDFLRKIQLCAFAVLAPGKLVEAELKDDAIRRGFPQPPPPAEPNAFKVGRAFWVSLGFVSCSVLAGYFAGLAIGVVTGAVPSVLVSGLQVIGAMFLLWGTLFVRGWDIQTVGGVRLTERVNQWIYRSLYCAGTAVIVASLALNVAGR